MQVISMIYFCDVIPVCQRLVPLPARTAFKKGDYTAPRTDLMGAARPQTLRRSPRQAFGGTPFMSASRIVLSKAGERRADLSSRSALHRKGRDSERMNR